MSCQILKFVLNKKIYNIFFSNFQRNGKNSACNVVKIADGSRPERLLSRLKLNSIDESVPRVTVLRSPKGPDGSKGFHANFRTPRPVGECT